MKPVRTIALPIEHARVDAQTHRVLAHDGAWVSIEPYQSDNGDAGVWVELMTPDGYSTAVLPIAAAHLIARALTVAAAEARDDHANDEALYRMSFGLSVRP